MNLLRSLITQLFISIIVDKDQIYLCAKSYKKSLVQDTFERSFEDIKRLNDYIQNLTMEFQVFYVSLFVTTMGQGLVPIGDPKLVSKYAIDYYSITSVPLGKYLIYINTKELERITAKFNKIIALNTLYSPFALLDYLFKASKSEKNTLCIYKYSNYLAVSIYKNQEAKFGAFFHILLEEEEASQEDEDVFEEIPISSSDEEEPSMEKLDLKSLDEALEDTTDLSHELGLDGDGDDEESELGNFTGDMKMCEYIIDAVKEFYDNELYESEFLEKIILYSENKVSKTALSFLENELFIKPKQELVNTMEIMQDIMLAELS